MQPHAVREFANDDLEWLIHRQIYLKRIDVLQLEYTPMAQYRGELPAHPLRAVRARRLFPIGRARPGSLSPGCIGRIEGACGIPARAALRAADAAGFRPGAGVHARQPRLPALVPAPAGAAEAGRPARGNRHARLRVPECGREPLTMLFVGSFRHDPNRVAHGLVRARSDAADPGAASRGRGWWWRARIRRRCTPTPISRGAGVAGICGRRARAAGALCGVRVPDPERLGRAGETAGGVRGGNSGGLDAGGRGRAGEQGRRVLRARRRPGGIRRTRAALFEDRRRPRPWRRGRARRWRRTGTWPRSRASWWRDTASWCGQAVRERAGLLRFGFEVLLEAADNVGGGAIEFLAGILWAGSKVDQRTWRDLGSTRKIVPLPRPKRN